MPVLTRCLLFVSVLLFIAGCAKTTTATSDSDVTAKKTELRQQDSQGLKHDPSDAAAGGDAKLLEAKTSLPGRPAWPRNMGEFSAVSRDGIPLFPRTLKGYVSEPGKDIAGKPYPVRGRIHVADGSEWKGLRHFPKTKNGCSFGVYMLRWRVSDPATRVYSTIDNPRWSNPNVATGAYGYMYGSVCDKPQFKFAKATKPNWPGLADVYYEVKFWEATP